MRARELLQEMIIDNGSILLATVGNVWIWRVPNEVYLEYYLKNKDSKWENPMPLPTSNSRVWWVGSVKTYKDGGLVDHFPGTYSYSHYWSYFTENNQQLIRLAGSLEIGAAALKRLAAITETTDAPNLAHKSIVLYQGRVQKTKDLMAKLVVGTLPDGSIVSKVPRELYWTVRKETYEPPKDWDTFWWITQPVAGTIKLWVNKNKVVGVGWIAASKAAQGVAAIQQLISQYGLELETKLPEVPDTTKKTIKPRSVMHKMLSYVSANPGANRSDWFVKHLGYSPQGMPGWTDSKAHDGLAASFGWISNKGTPGKYSLHITDLGAKVLAKLDAGESVDSSVKI